MRSLCGDPRFSNAACTGLGGTPSPSGQPQYYPAHLCWAVREVASQGGAGVQRGGQMPHQGGAGAGEGRAGFLHLLVTSPHVSPSSAQHTAVEEDAQ